MSAKRPKPAVPTKRRDPFGTFGEAKGLIVDILAASGGQLVGKTRLYKTFYAAHLFYAKAEKEYLTQHALARMPKGPGIDQGERLLNELQQEGVIAAEKASSEVWAEWTFTLKQKPPFDTESPRGKAILAALKWSKSKTATALSNETHQFSKSWNHHTDGAEIDPLEDLLTPAERGERERLLSEMDILVGRAFGQPQ